LRERLGVAPESVRVVYGGSAGPGLLTDIGDCVDGLFLGRFAHDPRAFAQILDEAAQLLGAHGEDSP
jgi:triosephosphate isomerase